VQFYISNAVDEEYVGLEPVYFGTIELGISTLCEPNRFAIGGSSTSSCAPTEPAADSTAAPSGGPESLNPAHWPTFGRRRLGAAICSWLD
jgi:hypothetical protein